MKINYSKKAIQDIRNAIAYYEEFAPKSSLDFALSLRLILDNILQFPQMGRMIEGDNNREFPIKNWPFVIPYKIKDKEILVLRVFHTSRNPKSKI